MVGNNLSDYQQPHDGSATHRYIGLLVLEDREFQAALQPERTGPVEDAISGTDFN